jgi:putative chitinase
MSALLTVFEIKKLYGRQLAYEPERFAAAVTNAFRKLKIDNPRVIHHCMAQMSHESGGFAHARESMKYSSTRITQIFGVGHHSARVTASEAVKLAGNEKALAERVYGLGNPKKARELGNTVAGDGYAFRGGGPLQTTGKGAYARMSKICGVDLVTDPNAISNVEIALLVGVANFVANGAVPYALQDNLEMVTRKVNGGEEGLASRASWLRRLRAIVPEKTLGQRLSSATVGFLSVPDPEPTATDALSDGQIASVQAKLKDLRYFSGPVDGCAKEHTEDAVTAFQKDNGIDPTGVMDDETLAAVATAEPRTERDVDAVELRDAGSKTITLADKIKKVAVTAGAGAGVTGLGNLTDPEAIGGTLEKIGGWNSTLSTAKDVLAPVWATVQPILDSVGPIVVHYWWVGAVGGAVYVWIKAHGVILARVADAQSYANLGR